MNQRFSSQAIFWATIIVTIVIAQLVRWLMMGNVSYNLGIAFSIAIPPMVASIIAAFIVLVVITFFYHNPAHDLGRTIALALVAGGGLSNLAERLMFDGRVADYLHLADISIYNLADVAIFCGILLLLYRLLRYGQI